MGQTTLDGRELSGAPTHRPLSARQREVLRFMRHHEGPTRPVEVGVLMHAGRGGWLHPVRGSATTIACCQWAASDGWDALRRLERRGLVRKVGRGRWVSNVQDEAWAA